MGDSQEYDRRLAGILRCYLGKAILEALRDPDTEEVYVNPDMRVRIVSHTHGRKETDNVLREADVVQLLRAVATSHGGDIGPEQPALAAALPGALGKCRLQGFVPPLTDAPAMVIRKPPGRVIPLEEYVEQHTLSEKGYRLIKRFVAEQKNIIVAGPTASGKTTLCNAILAEISRQFPDERLLILEDTPELFCTARDHLRLRTTDRVTMRHLVRYSLRSTPNRIIIGEVRDGSAKDLLDAWITGHPGGCGTVHGEDAVSALERLADLAREGAGGADQRTMVARAVNALILVTGHGVNRKVAEIVRIIPAASHGFDLKYEEL